MSLLDADLTDVVGCELDDAREILAAQGLEVRVTTVGRRSDGPLRVIRQEKSGHLCTLTCAHEAWGVERPR